MCSLISWMSESMIFPPWKVGAAKTSSFTGPLETHTIVIQSISTDIYCMLFYLLDITKTCSADMAQCEHCLFRIEEM